MEIKIIIPVGVELFHVDRYTDGLAEADSRFMQFRGERACKVT